MLPVKLHRHPSVQVPVESERAIEIHQLRAPAIPQAIRADRGIELEPEHGRWRAKRGRTDRLLLDSRRAGHADLQTVQHRPFLTVIQWPNRDPPVEVLELI